MHSLKSKVPPTPKNPIYFSQPQPTKLVVYDKDIKKVSFLQLPRLPSNFSAWARKQRGIYIDRCWAINGKVFRVSLYILWTSGGLDNYGVCIKKLENIVWSQCNQTRLGKCWFINSLVGGGIFFWCNEIF